MLSCQHTGDAQNLLNFRLLDLEMVAWTIFVRAEEVRKSEGHVLREETHARRLSTRSSSLQAHVHICTHLYTHMHMCTCTRTQRHRSCAYMRCTCVGSQVCTHICTHRNMDTGHRDRTHVHTHIHMHLCTCRHMHGLTGMHTCAHTCTHRHTSWLWDIQQVSRFLPS